MTAVYVAVVGPAQASPDEEETGEAVGRLLAERGAILMCGGLGGVMAAASRGALEAGGITVGILPGDDRAAGNRWLSVAIATGLGELRNGLLVRAADAVIAIGGGYGSLSELALALKAGKLVVGLGSWDIEGVQPAGSAAEAVDRALRPPPP